MPAGCVIFLDFDGVVSKVVHGASAFDRLVPHRVAHLSAIVERTGCKVVVASTWRRDPKTGRGLSAWQLEDALRSRGYRGKIDDITPFHREVSFPDEIARVRGGEILAWLRAQPESPRSVAILDDVALDGPMAPYVVQTVEAIGLTARDAERAVQLLQTPIRGTPPWEALEQVTLFAFAEGFA